MGEGFALSSLEQLGRRAARRCPPSTRSPAAGSSAMSVGVNPPKTPVTKGSSGIATATLPNVCKMPGPPAPFVPAPLPNIGKSGEKPDSYTQNVKIEGKAVAIKGASFGSMGDMASKGTGGGMVSANTHGPCKFIGPGSMDVKFEGGNVQLLSDPMTNNGGGSGSPANSATMLGLVQISTEKINPETECLACGHPLEEHDELETDDKKLVQAANDPANQSVPAVAKTVGGMKVGGNPPTYSFAGAPADGKLFNLKSKKEIPITDAQRKALESKGNTLGNCAEQKLLRNEFIDKGTAYPPEGGIKMGIAEKIKGTPTAKELRESTHKKKCGTCEPALVAMLCTKDKKMVEGEGN